MQSVWKNRSSLLRPKYGTLGFVALPNLIFFQIILPILAPIADLLFFFSIIWNWNRPEDMAIILGYYMVFIIIDVAISFLAFAFEGESFKKLIWLLPQRFFYRQFMYIVLFRSIKKALK